MRGYTFKQDRQPGKTKWPLPMVTLLHGCLFLILLYASLLWFASALRLISLPLLFWVLWGWIQFIRGTRTRLPYGLWLAAILTTLLPVDVSLHNTSGPPRFVPLEMGLPGPELMKAAARGEVMLGGCMVTGYEARWVWVW